MQSFHPEHRIDNSVPVRNDWGEVEVFMDQNNLADFEANRNACRIGIIGFGAIGRHVAEIIADTEDVYLMAIVDNLTVNDMAIAWKSNTFSIRIYGKRALLFKRKISEPGRNDDIVVAVFSGREHDQNPWGNLPVSHVIDTRNPCPEENRRIIYSAHGDVDSPNQLHNENQVVYTMVCGDNGVARNGFNLPIKYMKIIIVAEEAKLAIESLPERRGRSANLCFLAETDPTERICDPLEELYLKKRIFDPQGKLKLRGKDEDEQAKEMEAMDRLISALRCCIRIIRRAAIGGIFLTI